MRDMFMFVWDVAGLVVGIMILKGYIDGKKLIRELEAENADLRSRLDALTAQQSPETSSPEE